METRENISSSSTVNFVHLSHFNLFIGGNAFPGCRLPKAFVYISVFILQCRFLFSLPIFASFFIVCFFVRLRSRISGVPLFAVQVNIY
jgi:hypothetical protein